MEIPFAVLVLGVIVGSTYGVLAVGLVLVHRVTGIVNFAHGQIGVFGAALLALAMSRFDAPYWLMFPVAVAVAAGIAAAVDVVVMRRLRRAPVLMSMVATLGVAQVLLLLGFVINSEASAGQLFPQPPLLPSFTLGSLRITPAYSGMLLLTPLVVVGLAAFFRLSRTGIAVRAAAANPDAARLDGIFASRMSTLSWALAGAISAYTALLVLPSQGFVAGEAMGPALLVRALVAAVLARMTNLPIALLAGVAVGVLEQVVQWNFPASGVVDIVLFGGVLVALLVPRHDGTRRSDRGSWDAVEPWRPLPSSVRRVWVVRHAGWLGFATAVAVGAVLPVVLTNRATVVMVTIMAYAVVGLSVTVITGRSGQLTLGQFAIAAVGAVVSYQVSRRIGLFPLSIALAGVAAAAISVVIGLPALRIRGLMLAVATLAFAVAAQGWLLAQPWALGSGVDPGFPMMGDFGFDTAKRYYYFVLPFAVVAFWLAWNSRRGGSGRRLLGVRDNEEGARAFGIPATLVKLQAYAFAGFLAGVGGALYGHSLSLLSRQAFPVGVNIDLVAMTVIGGIGILAGPLLGALYIVGIPNFLPLDAAGLAATSAGWLFLVLMYPGGVAQLLAPARDAVVNRLTRRHGIASLGAGDGGRDGEAAFRGAAPSLRTSGRPSPMSRGGVLLSASGLVKRYGGIAAVDGVDLVVGAGETVGLIGPNGAGKTTLFELLSGFTAPDDGAIELLASDITRLAPERRAARGLIRSFQDPMLFPTMTVQETVMLSLERLDPARMTVELAGRFRADRRKEAQARDLVDMMGLGPFADTQVRALSTGTRRITELACVLALEPVLLLLDEPSSGVAQRETEALGLLLERIKTELDTTLVVIEHDIPLLMGISDRVIAMEAGRVIAEGPPDAVRNDAAVVTAYLGGDPTAVARSGGAVAAP